MSNKQTKQTKQTNGYRIGNGEVKTNKPKLVGLFTISI